MRDHIFRSRNTLSMIKQMICAGLWMVLLLVVLAPAQSLAEGVPRHIPTWAYDGGYGGQTDGTGAYSTNDASKRHMQTWLSYGEGAVDINGHPQKSYYDCYSGGACKSVFSYNPGLLFSSCWPHSEFISENSDEAYYLHDTEPASASTRTSYQRMACGQLTTVYFPNDLNPAVGQWFARKNFGSLPINTNTLVFQDDSGPSCSRFHHGDAWIGPVELRGGAGCDANLTRALRTVADQQKWPNGTPVGVVANAFGLGHFKTANTSILGLIAPGSNIVGGIAEDDQIYASTFTPQSVYGDVNTASLVYAENPAALYVILHTANPSPGSTMSCVDGQNNTEVACGALQLRRDALASFWLAYQAGRTVLWDNFNFSGGDCCGGKQSLAVYPEESIYPADPVRPLRPFVSGVASSNGSGCGANPGAGGIQSFVVACGTLNDGSTPAGVYVREFRRCYNFGDLIGSGQCAVVMNTTNAAIALQPAWFTQPYSHSMTIGSGAINGGDVLTAGCGDAKCPISALNPLGLGLALGSARVPAFDAIFLFHS